MHRWKGRKDGLNVAGGTCEAADSEAHKEVDQAIETVTKELQLKYASQAPARIGPAVRAAYNEAR